MAYGQGAAASLPICAAFLKKVFLDGRLGYSPDENFEMPPGFDPCGNKDDSFDYGMDVDESIGLDDLFGE